ncbi:MAG: hypothetical protein OSB82_12755, partial [Alphaproteobacteria bacterium]|nr:hypothetical protein [Alphaproteobacteria bacterium]
QKLKTAHQDFYYDQAEQRKRDAPQPPPPPLPPPTPQAPLQILNAPSVPDKLVVAEKAAAKIKAKPAARAKKYQKTAK